MKFLSQIASSFYSREGQKIKELCFVFPNRRAGIFFQKYLGDIAEKPIFSPSIITIDDLFSKLSKISRIDRVEALYRLYKVYVELSDSKESFDEFIFWGDVILADFDDVDKYQVDAQKLFANIKDLKEIESDYSFLSKTQMEAVQSFWSNFLPVLESEKKMKFRSTWEILYPLYLQFKKELEFDGLGYQGMIYRNIADQIEKENNSQILDGILSEFREVVFIGFNALSSCEKVLLRSLKKAGVADFYWDFSGDIITDIDNKSSLFMRENILEFPSKFKLDLSVENTQTVEIIGAPSAVGEAKIVSKILNTVGGGINTAVVLPDESLLMPVLYSIPSEIESVNVTMGYPLKTGSIVSLIESIMELQKGTFYFKRVLPILKHHYIKIIAKESAGGLIERIVKGNMVYIDQQEFNVHPILKLIFRPTKNISDYLLEILEYLNNSVELTNIEKEFVYFCYTAVSRMRDLMIPMNNDTYCKLLTQIINSTSIPFKGEPLSGLQIMGVLETRALDFDNVIICSMNDGVFPSKSPINSFIPHNLRKGFAMPDYEFKDGVMAYHFYRLISRARNIYLIYDTRSEGLKNGEMSRYIHQLKYHYQIPLKESIVTFSVSSNQQEEIIIEKSPDLVSKIHRLFLKGGESPFSASSINTYMDCPLKFYFQFVRNLSQEENVSEGVEADTFGSIFHTAMELLYDPFKGKLVTKEILETLNAQKERIDKITSDSFYKVLNVKDIRGHNLLIHKLISRYIHQTLKYDYSKAPFEYIDSERRVFFDFMLQNGLQVSIKGFIDRLDRRDGLLRIIDYKTGSGWEEFKDCQDLFDGELKKRNKIAFQLILYSLMIYQGESLVISPYMLRKLFKDKNPEMIVDKELLDEFSVFLDNTLSQILDDSTPFNQTEDVNKCSYCPYSVICR